MERRNRLRVVLGVWIVGAVGGLAAGQYGSGSGTADDPYLIYTAEQMNTIGTQPADWGKHFKLMADISLAAYPGKSFNCIGPDWEHAFRGVFDGNGHTISDFRHSGADAGATALFGSLSGKDAEIRDLGLVEPNVQAGTKPAAASLAGSVIRGTIRRCFVEGGIVCGSQTVGGLVGCNFDTITECGFAGSVTGTGDSIGGLVAQNCGIIEDCHVVADVSGGAGSDIGGLVGRNASNGTIDRCRSSGTVTGVNAVGGLTGGNGGVIRNSRTMGTVIGAQESWHVGGLTGGTSGFVTQCFAGGEVSGRHLTGGLAGSNSGQITNSRATGNTVGGEHTGGLVGHNRGGIIQACYSMGRVQGTESTGGLTGSNARGSVTDSFWDTETSGQASSTGGAGRTTTDMRTARTFLNADWDFVDETANGTEDVWWILEGRDYPRLWWERGPCDDFADGTARPLWTVYQPQAERVSVREVNGRLEVVATAQAAGVNALYMSDGWQLDARQDFAISVDFHLGKQGAGKGWVTIGLTRDLDGEPLAQWARLEAGCVEGQPLYYFCQLRDDFSMRERSTERLSDEGTLFISYCAEADELYFSPTGHGRAGAWHTATGLLRDRWGGAPVRVMIGGGSWEMVLARGEAWLDNFAVDTGNVLE